LQRLYWRNRDPDARTRDILHGAIRIAGSGGMIGSRNS
jgi:hypothetical protein